MKKIAKITIALTLLFLNKNIIKAANYIWPIEEKNAYETKIEYGYGPRNYNYKSYDGQYNYGIKEKPYGNQTENHYGVDIIGIKDQTYNVVSVANGTVLTTSLDQSYKPGLNFKDQNQRNASYDGGGYGNYIVIEEEKTGLCFLYAHLKAGSVTLRNGDKVQAGQVIGTMGSSGDSGHMHLHFEVRRNRYNTTYGINLVITTGYEKETLNPINYIGQEAPKKIEETPKEEIGESFEEDNIEPENIGEIGEAYSISRADIKNITVETTNEYKKINIEFDKEVEILEIPRLEVKIKDETKEANYISNLKGTIHSYIIRYNSFDITTYGNIYINIKGGRIIDTENRIPALYQIKNKYIGTLNPLSIQNTYEETYNNLKGDLNNDGIVDARDASIALRISSKISTYTPLTQTEEEQAKRADMNDDGIIDQRDASRILSYYATESVSESEKTRKEIIKCDLNNDGKVTLSDYNILESNINSKNNKYDLNEDNIVNYIDIEFFKKILKENGQR